MTLIALGILASVVTKVVTYLNTRLTGTVIEGKAAFILALTISILGGIYHVATTQGFNLGDWQSIVTSVATTWAFSEAFFQVVVKKLNLSV